MLIAALITLLLALLFWMGTYRAYHASTNNESLEFLGVFFYGPLAIVCTLLSLLFGAIWLVGLLF